ncbi:MAG: hypothetical protein AAF441_17350 [Pseudomonadota bacterium]
MVTNAAENLATGDGATGEREQRIALARESFSGRTLTEGQFKEAWAITGILDQEIQRTGSFRDKLTDYSHAFARSEKFDALRGETILRDLYSARTGQTMNQVREGLLEREKCLPQDAQARALQAANSIEQMIKEGRTQPFYKAYDTAAIKLAGELKITQSGAKELMKEAYRTAHNRGLYETGKEVEEAYHKPVREAEIAARKAEKIEAEGRTQTQARSMS